MSSSLRSRSNTFASLELERFAELRGNGEWLQPRLRGSRARFLLLRDDGRALVTTHTAALRELDQAERDRFASDAELPDLVARVLRENPQKRNEVKKLVTQWRADTHQL